MCISLFAYHTSTDFPLVFVSNRDEFHIRDTASANFWEDHGSILGGKDLEGGGTWLGIRKDGKIANLTNYRDFRLKLKEGAPTRGLLVSNYLTENIAAEDYFKSISGSGDLYNPYNLIAGDLKSLSFFSNREGIIKKIPAGVHGLSNKFLNTEWPKVQKGKAGLAKVLEASTLNIDSIFELMRNTDQYPDSQLPDTGGGIDFERMASPIFIENEVYGTRTTSVIVIDGKGEVKFEERNFDSLGNQVEEARYSFKLKI